jgi:hypothetical protein
MKTLKLLFIPFLFLVAMSCVKENTQMNIQSSLQNNIIENCDSGKWIGVYANGLTQGENYDTVKASAFIANGIACLSESPYPISFYTSIQLKIPNCHNFIGDSSKLVVNLKNPSTGIHPVSANDVSLFIIGANDTAHVTFIGDKHSDYTSVGIGSKQFTHVRELVKVFEHYTSVSLELKDGILSVYLNDTQGVTFPYKLFDRIGNVKKIAIVFKGSGYLNWVKIFNTSTNTQIMQEDFNISGESSVVWY